MTKMSCLYPDRDAALVAYLYDDDGDFSAAERAAFETHVMTCLACRSELAELRGVRSTIAMWTPPEPARPFALESRGADPELRVPSPEPRTWWHHVPVWAQVAAAMLVLGVSMSIANLNIRYDRNGLNVTTGWSRSGTVAQAQVPASAAGAPTLADLAALRTELRSEIRAQAPAAATPAASGAAMTDAEFQRRVRVLLEESETRQQKDLALRLTQLQADFYAQRQADLARINQNIGYIQTTYGNTYGDLRNYVIRASQTR